MKAKQKEPNFDKLITFINQEIPKKQTNLAILLAFERIDKMDETKKWSLAELGDFMEENEHPDYKKFNAFFKKYATIARNIIERSQLFKDNLYLINKNHFEASSKLLDPEFYHIYQPRILNYDIAYYAYMKCLDWYDCNINKNQWTAWWSLVEFKKGKLVGVYLGETMDAEMFWESVDEQVAAMPKFKRKKRGILAKLFN